MSTVQNPEQSVFAFDVEDALMCGVDEAGRGPLAGPVFAAAVILDPGNPIAGLRDSKKLTAARRDVLALQIRRHALAWSIAQCSEEEIDRLNILQATMLAMRRAVRSTPVTVPWMTRAPAQFARRMASIWHCAWV